MKDKLAGYSIFLLSLTVLGAWCTFTIIGIVDWGSTQSLLGLSQTNNQILTISLIAAPIILGMMVVLGIAAWIGWTMARTPPPAPIDLEDFESAEEEAS